MKQPNGSTMEIIAFEKKAQAEALRETGTFHVNALVRVNGDTLRGVFRPRWNGTGLETPQEADIITLEHIEQA